VARGAVSDWPEEEVVDLVEDADDEGTVTRVSPPAPSPLFKRVIGSRYHW